MLRYHYHFNDQCSHHVETSQLIRRANQLTGFYMMGTLAVTRLTYYSFLAFSVGTVMENRAKMG